MIAAWSPTQESFVGASLAIGAAAAVSVWTAARHAWSDGRVRAAAVLAALGAVVYMQPPGITRLLSLPGFRVVRTYQFRILVALGVAVAVGVGVDAAISNPGARKAMARAARIVGLSLAAAWILVLILWRPIVTTIAERVRLARPTSSVIAARSALAPRMAVQIAAFLILAVVVSRVQGRRLAAGLCAVLLLEAGALWFTWHPTINPQEARPEIPEIAAAGRVVGAGRVIGIGAPNLATMYGIRDVDAYDMVSRSDGRYHRLLGSTGKFGGFFVLTDKRGVPVPAAADILSARVVLVWPGLQPPLPGMVLVRDGRVRLYVNPNSLPRARLVGDATVAPDADVALDNVRAPGFNPATHVVLDRIPAPLPQAGGGSAAIIRDEASRVTIETEAAGPRILVLGDTAAPGWSARLDGKPVPILTAYARVRAVALPAGRHVVSMSYRPPGFIPGMVACIIAVVALLSAVIWTPSTRRAPETP